MYNIFSFKEIVKLRMNQPITLKGSNLTVLRLQVFSSDFKEAFEEVEKRSKLLPGFFEKATIIIDFFCDIGEKDNFLEFVNSLNALGANVIGLSFQTEEQGGGIEDYGLPILPFSNKDNRELPAPVDVEEKVEGPEDLHPQETKILDRTVRSGQQFYASRSDLIAKANVNNGAEVLADGNVNVYGCLKGKAIAGVNGDIGARIFSRGFSPELVCIAGVYSTKEDIPQFSQTDLVEVSLVDNKLVFNKL
jgi:septum site-determining protein MinC